MCRPRRTIPPILERKEVRRDEEDVERKGAAAGGGLLGCNEEGRHGKYWEILPQVKQLKKRKLKLPVGGQKKTGRQGKVFLAERSLSVFFLRV
jgi:hypothetical protein